MLLQYGGLDPLRWLGWQAEIFVNPRMRVYGTLGNPDFVAAWLCATLPLARGAAMALQLAAILATAAASPSPGPRLENEHFSVALDPATGAITSLRARF